ncbi:MAG: rane protein [Clostridiaceae bacterium]|jgi:uncharacterized membrane protein YjjP (DUF1212 family)|nr:rane protein [Clostridiaceae bacterium]
MDINRIMHIAAEAGKIVLENGGETYRVEETINRICHAYNIENTESFVTPTGIMMSATSEFGQTISIVKRIKVRTTNLEKISRVNDLSRNIRIKGYTLEYVENQLSKIDEVKKYSNKAIVLFSCIGAGFFTLMFGGSFRDFIVSFIIGGTITTSTILLNRFQTNSFFINIVGGALAALLALVSVRFNFGSSVDKIVIGSIMLLVPGLNITNAIRDTISGDLVAGISRGIEAFLVAVAIAVGTGIVFKIWFLANGGF